MAFFNFATVFFLVFTSLTAYSSLKKKPIKHSDIKSNELVAFCDSAGYTDALKLFININISARMSAAAAQKEAVTQTAFIALIEMYTHLLYQNEIDSTDLKQLTQIYKTPYGQIYARVMSATYPYAAFEKAILLEEVKMTENKLEINLLKKSFIVTKFRDVEDISIVNIRKKHQREVTPEQIEESFENLVKANAVALTKEGLTNSNLKKFVKQIDRPRYRKIYTLLNNPLTFEEFMTAYIDNTSR